MKGASRRERSRGGQIGGVGEEGADAEGAESEG
jgi:hypothetical protein